MIKRQFVFGVILLCGLVGLVGCDNTQGTTSQSNTALLNNRPGTDDNQNNGAGAGTAEKPASSGGSSWTDPAITNGGKRNPYGTGRTASGSNGS